MNQQGPSQNSSGDHKRLSKFLSFILRHHPESIGIQLDAQGWVDIDELLQAAREDGQPFTRDLLEAVVRDNDKQRFSISNDGCRIRANQGHSLRSVELELEPRCPPDELYHGTVPRFLESIREQGLLKGARNSVHLSADRTTAISVGSRRGKPVVLEIAALAMAEQGYEFFLSENGVWLTETVPPDFIRFP